MSHELGEVVSNRTDWYPWLVDLVGAALCNQPVAAALTFHLSQVTAPVAPAIVLLPAGLEIVCVIVRAFDANAAGSGMFFKRARTPGLQVMLPAQTACDEGFVAVTLCAATG